jgi:hypothetical protein
VRVVLSVLEGMGVAEEVKAARWKGSIPRPPREQIDKAASVFEARRISDRRRLNDLLKYMNSQECRVSMMREYFGEPPARAVAAAIRAPVWTASCSIPGPPDQRHDLHAATDFHARKRRRKRGERCGAKCKCQDSRRHRCKLQARR